LINLFKTGRGENINMWYKDKNPLCAVCKKNIYDPVSVFIVQWIKNKGRKDSLIHINCIKKFVKEPLCVIQYRWSVILTVTIPKNSIPIFIQAPSLSPSKNNISVFDEANIISDTTTDHAWRSKVYPSIEGASIGNKELIEETLHKEKLIQQNPVLFLSEQKELSKKKNLLQRCKNESDE